MIEQILKKAIRTKLRVSFRYDDELTHRVFAPYIIYKSGENILVAGTQFRDYKNILAKIEPHKFNLGKIKNLRITPIKFEYDSRFNKNRAEYSDTIYVINP